MSVIQRLEKVNVDLITAKPPRLMGKAKLVFLEPLTKASTPKLTQAWPIRPTAEGADKFSLEVRLDADAESFKTALTNFDLRVRRLAIENKKSWFGKAADEIESEADLRQMQTMSVKKGSEKQDGTRYDDTVKFKITGWQECVEDVLYKGEGDKKYPADVKWKTRLVGPSNSNGPEESHTKFYICENKNMATGKEQMAPMTPCQDPAGNQIRDAHGNVVWEWVGPKHCQPGCRLTIVFQPTMVWLASKFGVTLAAKQVFITPAPPKAKHVVEGIEIVEAVDPIMASRAVRQALASDDSRDLDQVPPEDDSLAENTAIVEAPAAKVAETAAEAPAEVKEESKKRKAATTLESPAKKTKKSKTVALDEDF